MTQKNEAEFRFQKPAMYKIKVLGALKENWSERLLGMQISVERSQGKTPVSVLIGRISDQSALSGVLNALYEFNMTILSVKMLKSR